jgi:SAM-dependent methyltransferase
VKTSTRLRKVLNRYRYSEVGPLRFAIGCAAGIYHCVSAPFRLCLDGGYRSVVFLRLFRPQDLHQSTVLTRMNRYPEIFLACSEYFEGRSDLKILSYGCATGEEVLTLRHYFPSAFILGVEINRHALAVAKRQQVDDRMAFLESDPTAIAGIGPFDAIFCMAVLQRTPMRVKAARIEDLRPIYPFDKFEAKVSELDSWLKNDGLLVVHHSQYAVEDAAAGSKYRPLKTAKSISDLGPKFDRDSFRCDRPTDSVFVKLQY